ncbi:MAG: ABC transporter ATP-binding protein [Acidimicrobiales bacterium]
MLAVEVDRLSVRYGRLTAVEALSFSVNAGQVVTLLGPNGAGKTTTVETLEGFRRPDEGSVRVLGLDPVRDHAAFTRAAGVMPQRGGIYNGIRPGEALRLFAAYYPNPLDPAALLERVGLTGRARTSWRRLSGGEQQRLSLALALVGRPQVLFLDEPTAGVDLDGRRVIRELVDEARRAGVAVLLTTHDLDEAERMSDRVVIIDRGRLVASGTPDELRASAALADLRFAAPAGIDLVELGAALGASVEEVTPGEYLVRGEPTPALVAELTRWLADRDLALGDLRAGRQRLEDVFLRLTRYGEGLEG